jgi:hypothetical protein
VRGRRRADPIDANNMMCVSEANGAIVEDGDVNYYLLRFTGRPIVDGHLREHEVRLTVGMLPETASLVIRGLTDLLAEHDSNALYDAGVVATRVPVPPQAPD